LNIGDGTSPTFLFLSGFEQISEFIATSRVASNQDRGYFLS